MRFLAAIGALAIVIGIGAAAFFFGGFYNVAGTAEDPAPVTWALTRVRVASINRHANDSPPASFGDAAMVQAGAKAYASFSCATCHGGDKWTRSTVDYQAPPSADLGLGAGEEQVIGAELRRTATQPNTPGPAVLPAFPGVLLDVGTFAPNAVGGRTNEIRFNGADVSQAISPLGVNGLNIPSLLSVHETAPYFYSGLAQTLEQVLDGSQDGNGGVRHHFVAAPADRAALVAFLRSIDDTTPTFP